MAESYTEPSWTQNKYTLHKATSTLDTQHNVHVTFIHTECLCFIVMPIAVMLIVVLLSLAILTVIMLGVILLGVILLSVLSPITELFYGLHQSCFGIFFFD